MDIQPKVRVRFAPSPTGQLHVGNARTALFNWLFARQKGGTMVLRVEDTDLDRSEARFEDQLRDDLKWLGLDWDEGPDVGGPFGPYRQSDRLQLYREHAERLLREHKAYLCFCTEEEIQKQRDSAMAEQRQPVYSGKCRQINPAEAERRRAAGEPCAIRLRIPEHPIRFHDMIRGDVEFPNEVVGDPIILRSNGMPVYNYVVVIDDALMEITHVIRGDDHLSNTPKQVALYEALGWPTPQFAHLSTILGPDRTRLSKRHGATSIANFREQGILPEALMNYLALLGWAPTGGTREIFSKEELIREFQLERVTPSSAVFDPEKLYWLNRHYIGQKRQESITVIPPAATASATAFLERVKISALTAESLAYFQSAGLLPREPESAVLTWLDKVIALISPSVNRLDELPPRSAFTFSYDAKTALESPDNAEVLALPKTPEVLESFARRIQADDLAQSDQLTPERFKAIVNEIKTETGAKGRELFHPIRIMLTGSHSGPDFDKVIPILEEGSRLSLPKPVMSVRERVAVFSAVRV